MTQLLVSVRNAEEAKSAILAGADLLDVKEPDHGSLGPASPEVWRSIAVESAGRCPLSAALGELIDFVPHDCSEDLAGFSFAKLGPAGCRHARDWVGQWKEALGSLPCEVHAVAAAYADHAVAGAPSPEEVLLVGKSIGCKVFLLDTYSKIQGDVFSHFTDDEIAALFTEAKQLGLMTVIGGSLTEKTLPRALALQPDVIAVRGGVCRGSRRNALEFALVRQWAESCHAHR